MVDRRRDPSQSARTRRRLDGGRRVRPSETLGKAPRRRHSRSARSHELANLDVVLAGRRTKDAVERHGHPPQRREPIGRRAATEASPQAVIAWPGLVSERSIVLAAYRAARHSIRVVSRAGFRLRSRELARTAALPTKSNGVVMANRLSNIGEEAARCTRCSLYLNATQTVFGEGPT